MSEIPHLSVSLYVVLSILCAMCSAVFSGLTLGLLTLDVVQLELMIKLEEKTKEDERKAKYASKILPLRKNSNYLLVTLLMGNVAVNSAFSILLGFLTDGLIGFLVSTVVITIFGEILPQAIFARYGLILGGIFADVVYIIEWIFLPIVKPISVLLDYALGKDLGSVYNKKQLKALIDYHEVKLHVLHEDEAKILKGGLGLSFNTVFSCMTALQNIFGLDLNTSFTPLLVMQLLKSGFSQIPVFDYSKKECIVGLLRVNDLIFINYEQTPTVQSVLQICGKEIYAVDYNATLLSVFTHFKKNNHNNFAVVRRVIKNEKNFDFSYEHIGIITLGDILKEIIQEKISDDNSTKKYSMLSNIVKEFKNISKKHDNNIVSERNNLEFSHINEENDEYLHSNYCNNEYSDTHKYEKIKGVSELTNKTSIKERMRINNIIDIEENNECYENEYTLLSKGRIKLFDGCREKLKLLDFEESFALSYYLSIICSCFNPDILHPFVLHNLLFSQHVYSLPRYTPLFIEDAPTDLLVILLQGKIKVVYSSYQNVAEEEEILIKDENQKEKLEYVEGCLQILGEESFGIPNILNIKKEFSSCMLAKETSSSSSCCCLACCENFKNCRNALCSSNKNLDIKSGRKDDWNDRFGVCSSVTCRYAAPRSNGGGALVADCISGCFSTECNSSPCGFLDFPGRTFSAPNQSDRSSCGESISSTDDGKTAALDFHKRRKNLKRRAIRQQKSMKSKKCFRRRRRSARSVAVDDGLRQNKVSRHPANYAFQEIEKKALSNMTDRSHGKCVATACGISSSTQEESEDSATSCGFCDHRAHSRNSSELRNYNKENDQASYALLDRDFSQRFTLAKHNVVENIESNPDVSNRFVLSVNRYVRKKLTSKKSKIFDKIKSTRAALLSLNRKRTFPFKSFSSLFPYNKTSRSNTNAYVKIHNRASTKNSKEKIMNDFENCLKKAVQKKYFKPKFSAYADDENCRIICLHRNDYLYSLRAATACLPLSDGFSCDDVNCSPAVFSSFLSSKEEKCEKSILFDKALLLPFEKNYYKPIAKKNCLSGSFGYKSIYSLFAPRNFSRNCASQGNFNFASKNEQECLSAKSDCFCTSLPVDNITTCGTNYSKDFGDLPSPKNREHTSGCLLDSPRSVALSPVPPLTKAPKNTCATPFKPKKRDSTNAYLPVICDFRPSCSQQVNHFFLDFDTNYDNIKTVNTSPCSLLGASTHATSIP